MPKKNVGAAGRTEGQGGTAKRDSATGGGGKQAQAPRARKSLLSLMSLVVQIIVLVLVIRTFLVATFVITSGSMEGTLLEGDFLVVNRAAIGSRVPFTDVRIPGYSQPRRGDILVFDPIHEDDVTVVKRLVGMPGDTLEMRGRALYVNGVAQDEPYVVKSAPSADAHDPSMMWQLGHLVGGPRQDYRPTRDHWGPVAVPEGRYFMLGDNRDASLDSRFWGFLDRGRFEGRAMIIYYSYNRESFRPFPWIREIRASRIGNLIR